jgi:hypothetical protein
MAVRLSAPRTGHPLPTGRFPVLIYVRGWVGPRAIVRLEGLGQLKKFNDLIGNRTRDLPACSIVPRTTTLTRVHPFVLYRFQLILVKAHKLFNKKTSANNCFSVTTFIPKNPSSVHWYTPFKPVCLRYCMRSYLVNVWSNATYIFDCAPNALPGISLSNCDLKLLDKLRIVTSQHRTHLNPIIPVNTVLRKHIIRRKLLN